MCGIAGAYNVPNAAEVVREMLLQMQSRGHEAAGIVSWDGAGLHAVRNFGRVRLAFRGVKFAEELPGTAAIGHVWYSTTAGPGSAPNVQPLIGDVGGVPTAAAHNGDLENYSVLRDKYASQGAAFRTTSDTELFLTLADRSAAPAFQGRIADVMREVSGAYSMLYLRGGELHAVRDPLGIRPLLEAQCGEGRLFASESCAFGALTPEICAPVTDVQDVREGAVYSIDGAGLSIRHAGDRLDAAGNRRTAHCIFEYVYFSRLNSVINGLSVYAFRKRIGASAARMFMKQCTERGIDTRGMIVCGVPDSALGIATGFVQESGLFYEPFLIRNHDADRTFLDPGSDEERKRAVAAKIGTVGDAVRGRKVVVIDDSIVRGNTMPQIVALLFKAGATEVHVVIASPPWIRRCTLGIATKTDKELFTVRCPTPESRSAEIGATSLTSLQIEDLYAAASDVARQRHCAMCMTGVHPENGLVSLR